MTIHYFKGHVDLVVPLNGDKLIWIIKRCQGLGAVREEAAATELKGWGEGADVVVVAHALQRAEVKVGTGTIPLGPPFTQPIRLKLERRVARLLTGSSQWTPHSLHNLTKSIFLLWTPRGQNINEELPSGDRYVLYGREVSLVLEVGGSDDVVVLGVRGGGGVEDARCSPVP